MFAVACESHLTVFDINGRLIADLDLKTNHNTGLFAANARASDVHSIPEAPLQAASLASKFSTAPKLPAVTECAFESFEFCFGTSFSF